MIEINSFRLTPNIYFGIIVKRHLQKSWWLYVLCLLFSLYFLFSTDRSSFAVFMIIFGIIYLPSVLIYYFFWATSSKNNTLFLDRKLTLESEKLSMNADGIYSELAYKHVQKIVETSDYFLLYVAKSQFVYIPKSAFVDAADIEKFKRIIEQEA